MRLFIDDYWLIKAFFVKIFTTSKTSLVLTHINTNPVLLIKLVAIKLGMWAEVHAYNHFRNILRLFDVLTKCPFTVSETMGEYYL